MGESNKIEVSDFVPPLGIAEIPLLGKILIYFIIYL